MCQKAAAAVVRQAGHLRRHRREEVAQEEEEEGEGEVLLRWIGIREAVAGSQLPAVGEEGEGQQNRGEVGKRAVRVAEGSPGTQVLQVEVEEARLSSEAEAEGPRAERSRV